MEKVTKSYGIINTIDWELFKKGRVNIFCSTEEIAVQFMRGARNNDVSWYDGKNDTRFSWYTGLKGIWYSVDPDDGNLLQCGHPFEDELNYVYIPKVEDKEDQKPKNTSDIINILSLSSFSDEQLLFELERREQEREKEEKNNKIRQALVCLNEAFENLNTLVSVKVGEQDVIGFDYLESMGIVDTITKI